MLRHQPYGIMLVISLQKILTDKKLISRWDGWTLLANSNYCLQNAIVVKTLPLNFFVTFAYLIGESRLFGRAVTFLILRLINTLSYLLTSSSDVCW